MFTQSKIIIAILSTAALLSMGAKAALAAEHSHEHAQHAGHSEQPQLTLNNGNKWETDDNLRLGMRRIRDALSAELPAIHSGKATAKQYRALAQKTNDQIAFMVKNCKLDQQTDVMLHLVLTDIIAGAGAMAGKDISEARKGVEKIAEALDSYGTYFNHPDWYGIKPTH